MEIQGSQSHAATEAAIRDSDWWRQFKCQWPGWKVTLIELGDGGEEFIWPRKLILVDLVAPDLKWRLFHAGGHLALHMGTVRLGQKFTADQEDQADFRADLWMDRIDDRYWTREFGESA